MLTEVDKAAILKITSEIVWCIQRRNGGVRFVTSGSKSTFVPLDTLNKCPVQTAVLRDQCTNMTAKARALDNKKLESASPVTENGHTDLLEPTSFDKNL